MIRFLRKPIVNQVKSILKPIHPQPVLYYSPIKFFSDGQKPNSNKDSTNKYKEDFQELKSKIQANKTQEELKQKAKEETINEFKEKLSGTFKGNEKPTEGSNKPGAGSAEQANSSANNSQASGENQAKADQTADQASGQAAGEANTDSKAKVEEPKKPSLIDRLSEKSPIFGKVANYVAESWEETFPKSKFQSKTAEVKKKIKEEKEREKEMEANKKEYTEEELAKMQETIPEHRRTAVAAFEGEVEKKTRADLIKERIKEKLLQTEVAQHIIKSDEYKEYQDFRKEMKQFREDLKDNLGQSQNRAVILSMAALDKVTSESNTALAIKEMRRYDKTFDMFDLEMDAKEIFLDIYNAFLQNNIEYLELVCSDMALAYFKVLLKKREVDDVHPKYDRLWEIDNAQLVGGRIPEKSLPCFTFTITTQEIHCNIHNKKKTVVDGADDRVISASYNFVLKLHDTPDLEMVGHKWCLVEIQPLGAVQQLV